jgi:hypothetical protein
MGSFAKAFPMAIHLLILLLVNGPVDTDRVEERGGVGDHGFDCETTETASVTEGHGVSSGSIHDG